MRIVTYTEARNNLKSVLDSTVEDADVTVIMRRDGENAVVMSEAQYASLMETLYLLSTPANASALARAIEQDKAGQAIPRSLIDV